MGRRDGSAMGLWLITSLCGLSTKLRAIRSRAFLLRRGRKVSQLARLRTSMLSELLKSKEMLFIILALISLSRMSLFQKAIG